MLQIYPNIFAKLSILAKRAPNVFARIPIHAKSVPNVLAKNQRSEKIEQQNISGNNCGAGKLFRWPAFHASHK